LLSLRIEADCFWLFVDRECLPESSPWLHDTGVDVLFGQRGGRLRHECMLRDRPNHKSKRGVCSASDSTATAAAAANDRLWVRCHRILQCIRHELFGQSEDWRQLLPTGIRAESIWLCRNHIGWLRHRQPNRLLPAGTGTGLPRQHLPDPAGASVTTAAAARYAAGKQLPVGRLVALLSNGIQRQLSRGNDPSARLLPHQPGSDLSV
jgi:hypothetical protein